MQNFFRKNRLLILHLSFWCLYFSFFFYQITLPRANYTEPNYLRAFLDAITQVIFIGAISYLNYFYFLPRFLKHKKLHIYFLELILPFALIMILHVLLKKQIYMPTLNAKRDFFSSSRFISQHMLNAFFIMLFVGMLRFVKDWFELEAKRKEIENEKLMSELRFLKEQINPHFLFNTLNNLYYLAHTQSPNTKEVIAKLSQMMRYMIYEANNEKVPVGNEIDYVKNYIDLEKLRLEDGFPIAFEIKGDYSNLFITPLIFITFLENAFKHGVENGNANSWVKVSFQFENYKCLYRVENSKYKEASSSAKVGIGLKNTMRRLNLSYLNKYNLEIEDKTDSYYVTLEIDLKE